MHGIPLNEVSREMPRCRSFRLTESRSVHWVTSTHFGAACLRSTLAQCRCYYTAVLVVVCSTCRCIRMYPVLTAGGKNWYSMVRHHNR
jgi:hypothetical protein